MLTLIKRKIEKLPLLSWLYLRCGLLLSYLNTALIIRPSSTTTTTVRFHSSPVGVFEPYFISYLDSRYIYTRQLLVYTFQTLLQPSTQPCDAAFILLCMSTCGVAVISVARLSPFASNFRCLLGFVKVLQENLGDCLVFGYCERYSYCFHLLH